MKSKISLLLYFCVFNLFISVNLYSQSGWFWQNPLPQGISLNSVKFLNNLIGVAVGASGLIYRSTDAGSNWTVISRNTQYILNSMELMDSNNLVAVGTIGTILKSTNRGINWSLLNSGTSSNLYFVKFVNQYTGFATGGSVVLKTTNAGMNWINISNGLGPTPLRGGYFINDSTGWVTTCSCYQECDSKIWMTSNNGLNWMQSYDLWNGLCPSITSFFFINNNTGWCNPYLKTVNGGLNWFSDGTFGEQIFFTNENIGWKDFTLNDTIYKTINGGINWNRIITNTYLSSNLFFIDSLKGWTVGQYGLIMRTTNGGNNWLQKVDNSYKDIIELRILDSNNILAGCSSGGILLKTTNSGVNWIPYNDCDGYGIEDLYYPTINIAYIASLPGEGYIGNILKSTNGGINWYNIDSTHDYGSSIYFINGDTGWVGSLDEIRKTTDGGQTWNNIIINGIAWVNSFSFINSQTGWACGFYVVKTTDAGISWSIQLTTNIDGFKNVRFSSVQDGWLIGYPQVLYRTSNGGNNWSQMFNFDNNYRLNSLLVKDSLNAIIVGGLYDNNSDLMLRTYNGGYNWYLLPSISNEHYWYSAAYIYNSLWIGGKGGAILKSTNFGGDPIGIIQAENTRPTSFSLSQNYPNPFNPTTKIKFNIAPSPIGEGRGEVVTLKIYDILGRELATLVNEQLKPGSYEYEWDGSKYASGVYFYKLTVSGPETSSGFSFTQTKKLVLLK